MSFIPFGLICQTERNQARKMTNMLFVQVYNYSVYYNTIYKHQILRPAVCIITPNSNIDIFPLNLINAGRYIALYVISCLFHNLTSFQFSKELCKATKLSELYTGVRSY